MERLACRPFRQEKPRHLREDAGTRGYAGGSLGHGDARLELDARHDLLHGPELHAVQPGAQRFHPRTVSRRPSPPHQRLVQARNHGVHPVRGVPRRDRAGSGMDRNGLPLRPLAGGDIGRDRRGRGACEYGLHSRIPGSRKPQPFPVVGGHRFLPLPAHSPQRWPAAPCHLGGSVLLFPLDPAVARDQ